MHIERYKYLLQSKPCGNRLCWTFRLYSRMKGKPTASRWETSNWVKLDKSNSPPKTSRQRPPCLSKVRLQLNDSTGDTWFKDQIYSLETLERYVHLIRHTRISLSLSQWNFFLVLGQSGLLKLFLFSKYQKAFIEIFLDIFLICTYFVRLIWAERSVILTLIDLIVSMEWVLIIPNFSMIWSV